MLAILGFISTGIFFAVFAHTFSELNTKHKLGLGAYSLGYYLLAIAFLLWGMVSGFDNSSALQRSIIIGDGLIIAATVAVLSVRIKNTVIVSSSAVIGLILFLYRIKQYPPDAYLKDGILLFNTPTPVAVVVTGLFIAVWLPVNLWVANRVTKAAHLEYLGQMYSLIYMLATVCAVIFLSAHRQATVILSFAAITICFAMLVASNYLILTMGKHGRKKATH